MSTDNEVLWWVHRDSILTGGSKEWIFRTREAARKFMQDKENKDRLHIYYYSIGRATWGPEQ